MLGFQNKQKKTNNLMEMSPSCDSASGVKHTQRDLDMCVPVFRGVHPELSCAALCFIWSAAVDTPTPAGSTTSTKHVSRSRASSSPSNWKDFFFLLRSIKLEWGPRLTSTLKPMIGLFFFFFKCRLTFFFSCHKHWKSNYLDVKQLRFSCEMFCQFLSILW